MPTFSFTRNYSDNTVLTEAQLDDLVDSIETAVNTTKLDSDNIQDLSITSSKLANSAVTTTKINTNAVTKAKIETAQQLPAGIIQAYGGTSVPTGWLLCDGSAVSRTTYSDLHTAIGEAFGSGDGSTTFNVPDLRGQFLRGTDNMGTGASGRDPDTGTRSAMNSGGNTGNNVGSVQTDEFGSHNHGGGNHTHTAEMQGNSGTPPFSEFAVGDNTDFPADQTTNSSGTIINTQGGNETRPTNAYVNFIIKT